jgi:protein-disulfide isomerase
VIAAIVIGGAVLLTNKGNGPTGADLPSPNAPLPSAVTPSGLPENGLTLGNANAAHTIDIWEDFQCPNCRDFTFGIEPQLITNYVANGKAKLVWHDELVIDSMTGGTESLDAANAARCANDQGKFWDYHDWLYTNQYSEGSGAFTKARLKNIAAMMGGLDTGKFDSCVDNGTHNTEIKTEQQHLPSGTPTTPSVQVDGKLMASYDYGTISAALDAALGITPSPSISVAPSASGSAPASAAPSASTAPSATPTPSASPAPSAS